jgi:methyl-accepting chemotaxis protein
MVPQFFRHLSLRAKVYLNVVLLCTVLGAVAVLSHWCLATTANLSEKALRFAGQLAALAAKVAEWTLQCRRFEKDVFLNIRTEATRAQYEKDWRNAFEQLVAAIAEFRAAATAEEDLRIAGEWAADAEQYRLALEQVFAGVRRGSIETPEQANAAIAPYKNRIRDLTTSSTEVSDRKMEKARQAERDLVELTAFFKTLILIVVTSAGIGFLIWAVLLAIDLLRPIKALSEAARRVGQGDLYPQLDLNRSDELGQLANCFNQMAARLRERASD